MAFSDLSSALDDACLDVFGLEGDGTVITFTPQDGSGALTIDGIVRRPPLEEENLPGSSKGTAVVRLFVRFTEITPNPQKGDLIAINGRTYAINDVQVDSAGGATLKLRTL